MTEDKLLTTKEAAKIKGVSDAYIRRLIIDGKLSAQKIGSKQRGQWLIKESDLAQITTRKEPRG